MKAELSRPEKIIVTETVAEIAAHIRDAFEDFAADVSADIWHLDAANPYWDFNLEADSSGNFDAWYDSGGGSSLHL
jgi:hypothetical protein